MPRKRPAAAVEPLNVSPKTACQLLSLGRTYIDRLCAEGVLESHKAGTDKFAPRLITMASIRAYAERGAKPKVLE